MFSTLSTQALAVLEAYKGTPYYNNRRQNIRMGLRALIGKGRPEEIAEEAHLFALKKKIEWQGLKPELRKKFLVDHHLGIDCSGFVYHILDAELLVRGLGPLSSCLKFPFANSLLSRLGRYLRKRYVENANVLTFAHPENSKVVGKGEIRVGDFIVIISPERKHMMLITEVRDTSIKYAHSLEAGTKDKYDNGVREEYVQVSELSLPVHRLHCLA